jgi:initiation factor 1A
MSKRRDNNIKKAPKIFVEKDDDHEYAFVTKKLGGGKFMVRLNLQNKETIGRICGKLRHGVSKRNNWIDVGSVVLVGFRDFQDGMVDIVHKYEQDEVNRLKKSAQIIQDVETKNNNEDISEDTGFDFEDL